MPGIPDMTLIVKGDVKTELYIYISVPYVIQIIVGNRLNTTITTMKSRMHQLALSTKGL